MANAKWTGDLLWNALNLNWAEFHKQHPEILRNTYKGKRAYWKAKVMSGETPMPEEPKLVKSWEVSAFNRETNEWETTLNHAYDHTDPEAEAAELWQATPAKITPSRRKPAQRDHQEWFVFSDPQIDYRRILDHETQQDELIPIHDERAMRCARLICADIQPNEIINLGDTVDLAQISRYPKDSDHFLRTMTRSFQRAHDYYSELRSDNPTAKLTEVDSNHNVRLKKHLMGNAPDLYDLRQAGSGSRYPVNSYPFMANLEHPDLNVNWVGGYGAADYSPEGFDDIIFRHGDISVSRGSTAAKLSGLNPDINVVQGHAHRMETATRTMRNGQYLSAVVVGALCKTTGEVPGVGTAVDDFNRPVHKQMNWQNGVLHIRAYGEGNYEFNHIQIRDGKAFYQGKEYDGNEI